MKNNVKQELNEDKKRALATELQLYKMRAVRFHQITKECPENSVFALICNKTSLYHRYRLPRFSIVARFGYIT